MFCYNTRRTDSLSEHTKNVLILFYSEELSPLEKKIADTLSYDMAFSFVTSGIIGTAGEENLKFTRRHLRYDYLTQGKGAIKIYKQLDDLLLDKKDDPSSIQNNNVYKTGLPKYISLISFSFFLVFTAFFFFLISYLIFLKSPSASLSDHGFIIIISFSLVFGLLNSCIALILFNIYFSRKYFGTDTITPNPFITSIFMRGSFIKTFATNVYFNKTLSVNNLMDEHSCISKENKRKDSESYLSPSLIVGDILFCKGNSIIGLSLTYDSHNINDKTNIFDEFIMSSQSLELFSYLENRKLSSKYSVSNKERIAATHDAL